MLLSRWSPGAALPGLLVLTALAAAPADAQRADFLFRAPTATLSFMGGWAMPGESSQFFQDVRDQLTVEPGDFASPAVMVELGLRLTERLDLAVGFEASGTRIRSEMEDWVTLDGRPIPQTTEFSRGRVMASVKGYLFRRGRRISEFAWIPNRWSPYIGGGVGVSWYELIQRGDFVDFETLDIFESSIRSTGAGPAAHAMGGLEVSLSPRLLIRGEYRHIWASAPLDPGAYDGFDDLDLSGGRATLGFAIRM